MSFHLKPIIAGFPYHGLVSDGLLTLPNSETMPVNQPDASNVLLNTARSPGPGQTDLDASNGWEWKDRLLVPGVTGLASTDLIFIDDSQVPYLIRVVTTKTGVLTVNVKATFVREYGIVQQGHGADFNVVLFDQDFDLSVGAQANLLYVGDPPNTVYGRVEQSPNGDSALINITGAFSTDAQYHLTSWQDWTICSIIKCEFSGQFDPATLTGVTGSASHYKTAADCCAPKSTTVLSEPDYKYYRLGHTETLQGWTPGAGSNDWLGALIDMQSTFSTNEFPGVEGAEHTAGIDEQEQAQTIIVYGHYDNAGAEQILSVDLSAHTHIDYGSPTVSYTMTPATAVWSYHCDHPFGSNPGTFTCDIHSPAAGVDLTQNYFESTSKAETRTYTAELKINGAAVESKDYVWTHNNTRVVDIDNDYLEWPSFDEGAKISADQADEEAPWLFPSSHSGRVYAPTAKDLAYWVVRGGPGGTVNQNTDTHVYTSTEWGEELYSGDTAPTDQGFDNFDLGFIGSRFLALSNTRTGSKVPAQSAYGASQANHAANIAYDPYTDTITDSDDPIGYI